MSSSSSASLVPRVGSIDAVLTVESTAEIPLIDIGKRILASLDRVSYALVLEAISLLNAGEKKNFLADMPSKRKNVYNVLINSASSTEFRVGYLHFCNEDGSVGQAISVFGDQIAEASAMCYNSFIPLINAIRVAAGTALEDGVGDGALPESMISTQALFRSAALNGVNKFTVVASRPEVFVKELAKAFNRGKAVDPTKDVTLTIARVTKNDGYMSYPHDLSYFK